jgi:hypothetical protein
VHYCFGTEFIEAGITMHIQKKQITKYVFTGRLDEKQKALDIVIKKDLRILRIGPQVRGLKVYENTFKLIAEKE